ncbi:MAG: heavy metal translocating P-type ATPase [Lachnospiraceae bacterium]|nr:heavy metal translocating P-type ATPase [Lachnospiraceae bacterium]
MQQYKVTGMSCAACSAKVEKSVLGVSGVESCNVSLLTNSMVVEGDVNPETIMDAVSRAGYKAFLPKNENDDLKDTESPKILKRLIASVAVLLPLMYVSMGHMMWNWPAPALLHSNRYAMGLYEMVLSAAVMIINRKFFVNGFKGLMHKAPNMDTLIAMGSGASFIYSLATLITTQDMDNYYFESAAMILTLITVGKYLEARSKGRTTDALKELMNLAPKTARLLKNGDEVEVLVEDVKVSDTFIVKAGESIPVDGKIIEGFAAIDEAVLTGESVPVDKKVGDSVSTATISKSGYIVCKATRIGEDTTLSQIIQMVSDAAAGKAPIAKIADKVSGVFVPCVLGIALVTFVAWLLLGEDFGYALTRAVSVLVISCPCALGLATPVAIMVGNGLGAKHGILFKTAVSLEETGKIDIVALDKTGTITKGQPEVTSVITAEGISAEDLLLNAYVLERKSEHPLSRAIVDYYEPKKEPIDIRIENYETFPGNGIKGDIITEEKITIFAGNYDFIKANILNGERPEDALLKQLDILKEKADSFAAKGHTPLYFAGGGKVYGVITVADTIKEDSAEAIEELKNLGLMVVMLTGDNEKTARAIANQAGVDDVVANVKPATKETVIRMLQKYGKVAMVGDGINDAPALTRADIGIAIGAGTDVAIDAADIVLMKSRLSDVAAAIKLSRFTLTNIHENLFWAFIFNIIGIPLAAGVWIPVFGWTLKPMFGAAAMSLSSFIVVSNALRINFFKLNKKAGNKGRRKSAISIDIIQKEIDNMEDFKMEITVNQMMCHHCEAHVKAALEKVDGIVEAVANHETNSVSITTNKEVSEDAIKAAVTEAGYEYVGIK